MLFTGSTVVCTVIEDEHRRKTDKTGRDERYILYGCHILGIAASSSSGRLHNRGRLLARPKASGIPLALWWFRATHRPRSPYAPLHLSSSLLQGFLFYPLLSMLRAPQPAPIYHTSDTNFALHFSSNKTTKLNALHRLFSFTAFLYPLLKLHVWISTLSTPATSDPFNAINSTLKTTTSLQKHERKTP
jgi:hypothetical protein